MKLNSIAVAACATAGLLAAVPASAACSLKTQPIAVKMTGAIPMVTNGLPMVEVKVNGKTGHFLLDSGSAVNQISAKFAAAQKLTSTKVTDKGPAVATVAKFEFAGATLANVPFASTDRLGEADGVIGQTVLRQGDVEYDLMGGKVQLAKAEGCEGVAMVYWAKDGQTYSEMPLEPLDKDAPFTKSEVTINGVKLRAMFDSGLPYTTITEKAAAKVGVKPGDPGVKSFGDAAARVWLGAFASVKIGDEEIKNAPLEIVRSDDDSYEVLLGADFFAAHHIYVANSQGKIYLTYSGLPGAPVFMAHTPQPAGMDTTAASRGRLEH